MGEEGGEKCACERALLASHQNRDHVQWNLSIKYTAGTQLAVLYREVSLVQR